MVWINNKHETLSSTSDTLTSTAMTASDFNQFLISIFGSGGTNEADITFNNDTGSNYVDRRSVNGGSDTTQTSQNNFRAVANAISNDTKFMVMYAFNKSDDEKLCIWESVSSEASGAGTAPTRFEHVGKWVNRSNDITEIDCTNDGGGDDASGSNLSAIGDGGTKTSDLANIESNSVFETTDTNKHYIWNSSTDTWTEVA